MRNSRTGGKVIFFAHQLHSPSRYWISRKTAFRINDWRYGAPRGVRATVGTCLFGFINHSASLFRRWCTMR
ncbi:hypothetical protein MTO96_017235 [Rhipicephalus appendiculatus]